MHTFENVVLIFLHNKDNFLLEFGRLSGDCFAEDPLLRNLVLNRVVLALGVGIFVRNLDRKCQYFLQFITPDSEHKKPY